MFEPRIVPIVNFAFDLHHSGAGKGHPRLQRLNLLNEMLQSAPGACDLSPKDAYLLVMWDISHCCAQTEADVTQKELGASVLEWAEADRQPGGF